MFGHTLRYFRKSKSLTLEYVARDIVTVAFLSKVERNLSDISLTNFLLLLNRMEVEFIEFMEVHENLSKKEKNYSIFEIHQLYANRNYQQLKEIQNKKIQLEFFSDKYISEIFINLLITKLEGKNTIDEEQSKNKIIQYLNDMENWTYSEYYLYCHCLNIFPHDQMIQLSSITIKRFQKLYKKISYEFSLVYMMLNNTIITCLERHDYPNAIFFMNLLLNYPMHKRDYYHRLKTISLNSILQFKLTNDTHELLKLKQILQTLHVLETDSCLYDQTKNQLKLLLPKNEFRMLFEHKNH